MIALVYDGDCPFCANYAALIKLRAKWPDIELVNAREKPDHPAATRVKREGLLIDEGMAVVEDDNIHYGADATQFLTGIPKPIYPFLRAGRNLTLRLLGRKKLGF